MLTSPTLLPWPGKLNLPGNLSIRTRHGRNGAFKIGYLRTPVYTFSVRDKALEQYDVGNYDGEFCIDRLYVNFYPTSSGGGFEIRAVVSDMRLFDFDETPEEAANEANQAEPEPADEETAFSKPSPASGAEPPPPQSPIATSPNQQSSADAPLVGASDNPPSDAASNSSSDESNSSSALNPGEADAKSEDATLFGMLWPLADRFKLDLTVERSRIKDQCKRLTALGWAPDWRTQEWYRKAA